ncbi:MULTISPECIES: dTMP kinase [Kordiimonas]|jgi:dTMP kinase|uniref:Thymidylate kinase n=1 Tax=Kordiimonas lacus TaxID=637679 RepID=A0A1G6WP64_9PROT|nr:MULTISPECIES: dTMP kinase [Kordiimonas]SDD66886.1 dTMP kinase [Kordiimonas lacus]
MDDISPKFISFEGGEGAGKSTQIKLLAKWLTGRGVEVVMTREPGGSTGAEEIRELLVKGETDRWTPMSEALLMTAARAEHVERTIKPALKRGVWVLCDRFFDSTIAYQGGARGLGIDKMRELQDMALHGLTPDLTFILDLPVDVGLARACGREALREDREDRFERMNFAFHENIRDAYLKIAESEPDRCVVIDANRDITTLQNDLRAEVNHRLVGMK